MPSSQNRGRKRSTDPFGDELPRVISPLNLIEMFDPDQDSDPRPLPSFKKKMIQNFMMEEGGSIESMSAGCLPPQPDGEIDNDFLSSSVVRLRPSFPDSVHSAAESLIN